MSNETLVLQQVLNLVKDTNIGDLTNQVMLAFGGIASITIIYFLLMVYIQSKINTKLKEQRDDINLLIMLVYEQQKKINSIHKLLIPEGTDVNINEQETERDDKLGDDNNHNNNLNNILPKMR